MRVETYSDRYYLDVVKLIHNFHDEAVGEYVGEFDPEAVIKTIVGLKENNAQNAFLMIVGESCEGIIAGLESHCMVNGRKMYQELIWYVNEPFRSRGVKLLKIVEERLKLNGFSIMIMAVLENSKTEKLKAFYEKVGYRKMETHYVREL